MNYLKEVRTMMNEKEKELINEEAKAEKEGIELPNESMESVTGGYVMPSGKLGQPSKSKS
jgi:hypothetical protein